MARFSLSLSVFATRCAICKLDRTAPIPSWAYSGELVAITRTPDELSIVCPQVNVPTGVQAEHDWRCIKVTGPLDFTLTGVLAALAGPLAQAHIPIFVISTYDTDYLLVKEDCLARALQALQQAGHHIK